MAAAATNQNYYANNNKKLNDMGLSVSDAQKVLQDSLNDKVEDDYFSFNNSNNNLIIESYHKDSPRKQNQNLGKENRSVIFISKIRILKYYFFFLDNG